MDHLYVIAWRDPRNGEILEIKAKKIRDSSLGLTFVAISEFVLASRSAIVNPAEEALARRFEHTKALHLSIHAIVSIEEVDTAEGLGLLADRSKLLLFPDKS